MSVIRFGPEFRDALFGPSEKRGNDFAPPMTPARSVRPFQPSKAYDEAPESVEPVAVEHDDLEDLDEVEPPTPSARMPARELTRSASGITGADMDAAAEDEEDTSSVYKDEKSKTIALPIFGKDGKVTDLKILVDNPEDPLTSVTFAGQGYTVSIDSKDFFEILISVIDW